MLDEKMLKNTYFMIFLQPEEQLALKYILKNWVLQNWESIALTLDTYVDLVKDLDGIEPESFVLPMMRTAIFRSAFESFYVGNLLSPTQSKIAAKHYEMLSKWFYEEKVAMTKDEVLNLSSEYHLS